LGKYNNFNTSNFLSSPHTRSRRSPVPVPVIAEIGRGENLAGINRKMSAAAWLTVGQ